MAEGRTAHPRDQRHKALESVLEALDMEHVLFPTTKANPIESDAFYVEILAVLAKRVIALERGRDEDAERIDNLEEAVAALLNRESRVDEAKADDK